MKKIFIILLCFVVLFTSFAIFASADEGEPSAYLWKATGFDLDYDNGAAEFYKIADLNKYQHTTYTDSDIWSIDISAFVNGTQYDILYIREHFIAWATVENGYIRKTIYAGTVGSYYNTLSTLYIINQPAQEVLDYLWFNSTTFEQTPNTCFGTYCSVADYDLNGYCDTCGNVLAYTLERDYTPQGYPSNLPPLPIGYDNTSQYVIFKVDGVTRLYTFSEDYGYVTHWVTSHNNGLVTVKTLDSYGNLMNTVRRSYELVGGDWVHTNTSDQNLSRFNKPEDTEFVYSTLTFYNEDGSVFFPIHLWEAVRQVSQRVTLMEAGEIMEVIMVILISALGLMGLLIGLYLLVKAFKAYRLN